MKVNAYLTEAEGIVAGTDPTDLAAAATACKKLGEIVSSLKGMGQDPRVLDALATTQEMVKQIKIAGFAGI